VPRGRSYSNVLFDPSLGLIIAGSSLQAKFTSYDEDGNRIWEPEGMQTIVAASFSQLFTL